MEYSEVWGVGLRREVTALVWYFLGCSSWSLSKVSEFMALSSRMIQGLDAKKLARS